MDFRSSDFKSPDLRSQPWRVRNLKYTDSLKKRCSPHQGCGATEVYNKIFQQLILVLWTLGPRTSDPGVQSLQNLWLHTSSGPKDQGLKVWGTIGPRYPLAHCWTIFLKSSGYRNIAQGGDPLYAAVDYKWCCRGQTIPNWTRFFAKKGGSIYFRARLFFWVMSVTFLGPGRVFLWPLDPFPILRGDFQEWGGI